MNFYEFCKKYKITDPVEKNELLTIVHDEFKRGYAIGVRNTEFKYEYKKFIDSEKEKNNAQDTRA